MDNDQAVKTYSGGKPNYTQPKEWEGLTEDERMTTMENCTYDGGKVSWNLFGLAIESKLKEKNTCNAWHGFTDPEIRGLVHQYRDDPFTLVMEAADMLMERNIS
tara:strand:- start:1568 stop:1879 length:312 start_codon:yes stop_codon:yes gene_type:complete